MITGMFVGSGGRGLNAMDAPKCLRLTSQYLRSGALSGSSAGSGYQYTIATRPMHGTLEYKGGAL